MKKFWKIFIPSFISACGIALAICYFVKGDETKAVVDTIIDYVNRPLGIVCGTTITLGGVAWIVIHYALKYHREKKQEELETLNNQLKDLEEKYKEELAKKESEIKELVEQFNEQVKTNEYICETLKLIPNKKVQERLGQFYEREERTND